MLKSHDKSDVFRKPQSGLVLVECAVGLEGTFCEATLEMGVRKTILAHSVPFILKGERGRGEITDQAVAGDQVSYKPSGHYNKYHALAGFNERNLYLTVLEAQCPRSRCQHSQGENLSRPCTQLPLFRVATWGEEQEQRDRQTGNALLSLLIKGANAILRALPPPD